MQELICCFRKIQKYLSEAGDLVALDAHAHRVFGAEHSLILVATVDEEAVTVGLGLGVLVDTRKHRRCRDAAAHAVSTSLLYVCVVLCVISFSFGIGPYPNQVN